MAKVLASWLAPILALHGSSLDLQASSSLGLRGNSLGLQASYSLGLRGYSLGLYDLVLDPLTAEADLIVVGMVGKLVEVNVVRFLHQHGLEILGKRKRIQTQFFRKN
jgi:hypothetical protein